MTHMQPHMLYNLLIDKAVAEVLFLTKLLNHLSQPDNILKTVA